MSAVENFGQHRDALMRTSAVRASNDHIARRAEALRFTSRVPLLCECDDPGCQALILVSVLIGAEVAGVLGALGAIPIAGSIQVLVVDYLRERRERAIEKPAIT